MLEDIKKIKIAEEEAETIVSDAKSKAVTLVNEAKNKAKNLYSEAIESNRVKFDSIVKGYENEGAEESEIVFAQSQKDIENIKNVSFEKFSNAVDFVIKEIL